MNELALRELALFAGAGGDNTIDKKRISSHNGNMRKDYSYGTEKTCPVCGEKFKARDKDRHGYESKYCSYACNNKSRRIHNEKKCAICGNIFTPIRPQTMCCSRKCGTEYRLSRIEKDPMVEIRAKMARKCCDMVHRSLRAKDNRTYKIIGYTPQELITHLESYFEEGMSWENYGNKRGDWSIDHTRPISTFDANTPINEINALSNLRPMWHSENCRKRDKWEGR